MLNLRTTGLVTLFAIWIAIDQKIQTAQAGKHALIVWRLLVERLRSALLHCVHIQSTQNEITITVEGRR